MDSAETFAAQFLRTGHLIPYAMYAHIAVQALIFFLGIVFFAVVLKRTRTFFCRQFGVLLGMWFLAVNAVPDFIWGKPVWQEYVAPAAKGMATAILFAVAGWIYCLHYLPRRELHKKA
ncbi:hypothetical protein HQ520_09310 [bacterium]|nr:hypothetical protein [bacterium]